MTCVGDVGVLDRLGVLQLVDRDLVAVGVVDVGALGERLELGEHHRDPRSGRSRCPTARGATATTIATISKAPAAMTSSIRGIHARRCTVRPTLVRGAAPSDVMRHRSHRRVHGEPVPGRRLASATMSDQSSPFPIRPFRFGVQLTASPTGTDWVEQARRIEGHGYDVATMPDHFDAPVRPGAGAAGDPRVPRRRCGRVRSCSTTTTNTRSCSPRNWRRWTCCPEGESRSASVPDG